MMSAENRYNYWCPSVVVYDSAAVTSERHDPATAILYFRPRHDERDNSPGCQNQPDATSVKTALAGQLAGVLTFTSSCFGPVRRICLRKTCVAVDTQGRFVLMVIGHSPRWAETKLDSLSDLVNTATGGLQELWADCGRDRETFVNKLSPLLDNLINRTFTDVTFNDNLQGDVSSSTTPTVVSPYSDASNPSPLGLNARLMGIGTKRRTPTREDPYSYSGGRDGNSLEKLCDIMRVPPSLQIPKSGMGGLFLKSQKSVEACMQHSGVLAGLTLYDNKSLSSQLDSNLSKIILSVSSSKCEANSSGDSTSINTPEADSLEPPNLLHQLKQHSIPLEKQPVEYQLPHGVTLHRIHISYEDNLNLVRQQKYFKFPKKKEKNNGSLHSANSSLDLNTLRNILLEHQSLHNYPPTLPGLYDDYKIHADRMNFTNDYNMSRGYHSSVFPANNYSHNSINQPPTLDPIQLCAKGSRMSELMDGDRPSQSLPGTPRKIRVSTMLPDIGNNSPALRYKVLNSQRQSKSGLSSLHTPRRFLGSQTGLLPRKQYNNSSIRSSDFNESPMSGMSSLPRRTNLLSPPSLSLSYDCNQENKYKFGDADNSTDDESVVKFRQNGESKSRFSVKSGDSGFEEYAKGEVDLRNSKNKLNLHLGEGKVNRPLENNGVGGKILQEINGNVTDNDAQFMLSKSKSQLLDDIKKLDEDDSSRSGSEISVLELSSFIDLKENEAQDLENKEQSFEKSYLNEDQDHLDADLQDVNDLIPCSPSAMFPKFERLCLYRHTLDKACISLLIDESAISDPKLIYSLWGIGQSTLPSLEAQIRSVDFSGGPQAFNGVGDCFARRFGQSVYAVEPNNFNLESVNKSVEYFDMRPEVLEMTIRQGDNTLWGHKIASSLTLYQHTGPTRPGPPIPSDPMAKLPYRARKRLERDYAITLL